MTEVPPLRCDALSTHHNRWGYRGVERIRGKFRAVLGDKVWRSQYFDTSREAAAAYDTEARRRYGELACLNFPRPGERRVVVMDDDVCLRGHDRARFTYFKPDGRPGYCRACNRLAQIRAKARRKARA
jgi:hypothetical protein